MKGLVGYDRIQPILNSANWLQCRNLVQTYSPQSAADGALIEAWRADDCPRRSANQYAAFFRELDAWTEYWDIYHPETGGRYYFGSEQTEGYLSAFLPNPTRMRNPVFDAWKRLALSSAEDEPDPELLARFRSEASQPHVKEAALAVDELVSRLVREHFGTPEGAIDQEAYFDAMERFGKNTLPPSPERYERIPADDPRKSSSLHHTIEGHVMWFGWAVHLECVDLAAPADRNSAAIRRLLMAGIALGCSFDFACRERCRTRKEYTPANQQSRERIWSRANECALDFSRASREIRELFFIREYGDF